MIAPARPAVWLAAATAPAALLVAVLVPAAWYAGLALPGTVLLLLAADALLAAPARRAVVDATCDPHAPVGGDADARIAIRVAGRHPPRSCEVALASDPLLAMADGGRLAVPLDQGAGTAILPILAVRRGSASIDRLWLRWPGPLGLVWRQVERPAAIRVAILPDVRPVHESAARLFARHALDGLLAQADRGESTEFETLVEYRSGMDRRAIDWKQSARHLKLHAKETRSERNGNIVFVVDCGRQMSEPVAGLPRIDRAVTAMLLTAWIVLKLGDRVALHAFDSRPRLASQPIAGTASFGALQALAARIDYGVDETNYTLALTTLAGALKRRSMIVLFTEFTDLTSAEAMIAAAAHLIATHLMLIVVLRDDELEELADRAPATPGDIVRAITAAALLRERRLVLLRLRHLGAHIVESPHGEVAERLVAAYASLKRRGLL